MEQHQFKVSFPLKYKLLISVVSLLLIVIAFLTVSTTILLKDDKRTYTYTIQETEARLAGKEFVNLVNRSVDTLRQTLGRIDPKGTLVSTQKSTIDNLVNNQTSLVGVRLAFLNLKTAEPQIVHEALQSDLLTQHGLKSTDLKVKAEWIKINLEDLKSNAFTLINVAQTGLSPLVALVMADVKMENNPQGMPIAIGFLPIEAVGKDIKGSSLSIVNRAGWLLFDSDPSRLYARQNIRDDALFMSANQNKLTTGAQEYSQEDTEFLGTYVKPGFDLIVLTRTKVRTAMGPFYALIEKFFILGGMAIGIAIVFAILFAKTLTAPINRLYKATNEVAKGNFDLNLKEKGKDEIGALSESFNVMSRKISELIAESMEKVRMEGELAIASTVQKTLIPPSKFQNDKVLIRSHYEAASECGGDWWGFLPAQNKFGIFIADATGHGLPSALITAAARSCFSVLQEIVHDHPTFAWNPGQLLKYANRAVHDAAKGSIMMTFFAGVIDLEKHEMTYASAGHNPPWLFKQEGDSYQLKSLVAKGVRLGESSNATEFEEKKISMAPNDLLFLYTDGITEGMNRDGRMYGKKQVRKMVESQIGAGPENIIKTLIDDFKVHNDSKPLDDDITLAVATILS